MTAGTGDGTTNPTGQGERILCDITELVKGMQCQDCGVSFSCKHRGEPTGDCYSPKVHGSDCLLGATDCAECEANPNPTKQGDKPHPPVAPLDILDVLADFSTCLLNIEKSLSGLADLAESRSVSQGDVYCKLTDGLIDAMESVQVLRNQANEIELDEEDALPMGKPVLMDHKG